MKRPPLLALLVLVAGCLSRPAKPPPNFDLQSWIGRPIAELVATWGPPTGSSSGPSGQTYSWVATQYGERSLPVNRSPSGGPDDRQELEELRCRAVFAAAPDGTVLAAEWRGEECWMRH